MLKPLVVVLLKAIIPQSTSFLASADSLQDSLIVIVAR